MALLSSALLLLIALQLAVSLKINIVTSKCTPCHGDRNGIACLTLQQFVSSQVIGTIPNLTLELEAGVHVLETIFSTTRMNDYLEISGNNATVVCKRQYYYYSSYSLQFRYLQAVNITGITFVNCSRIYVSSVPRVTFSKCNFHYGVYSTSLELRHGTQATIQSCTFVGRARFGTGLYLYQVPVNISIDSCTFDHNDIGLQLYSSNRNHLIESSTFIDNNIGLQTRSSVYNTSTDSCTFVGNRQSIYISSARAVIYNSTFRNNGNNNYAGSVLYSTGSRNLVVIMESTMINNTASNGAVYIINDQYSSWYYWTSTRTWLLIDRCTFINNLAYGVGGALYLYMRGSRYSTYPSNDTISRSVFINNRATVSGGAISVVGNLSIVDSVFGYNDAPQCAVLDVRSSSLYFNLTLLSNTFLHNKAVNSTAVYNRTTVQFGGVACFRDASVIVSNGTFSHNIAAGGGGVMLVEGSNISINGSVFHNNTAGIDGGVLYTRFLSSNYTITQSSFTYNKAGDDGGVFYSGGIGNNVAISDSTFSHNTAADRGGAIITFRGEFGVISTNMFNNRANWGNDVAVCNAQSISTPAYFDGSFRARTYSANPLCSFYGEFTRFFGVPYPDDRSNIEIAHYLQVPGAVSNRTMIIAAPRFLENVTTSVSISTTTEDQSLKQLESKIVETSVVLYIFFSLVLVVVITVTIGFVVKFCFAKKTKKGRDNVQLPNTAYSDYNDSIEIYEEPIWKYEPPHT